MKSNFYEIKFLVTTFLLMLSGHVLNAQNFSFPESMNLDSTVNIIVEFEKPSMFYKTDKTTTVYQLLYSEFYSDLDSVLLNDTLAANANMQYTSKREYNRLLTGMSLSVPLYLKYQISRLPYVKNVYSDNVVHETLNESVPLINADDVHSSCATGIGIVISIIDTGVDYMHNALGGGFGEGKKVIGGYDFVNNDDDPMDDSEVSHGTHVAGIAAANSVAIVGIAPGASLLAYKVLNSSGVGYDSDVIAAIEASLDPNGDGYFSDHADVINMSLGGAYDSNSENLVTQKVEEAIALTNGAVVFCIAAGNIEDEFSIKIASPGNAPSAITVGSSTKTDGMSSFSRIGSGIESTIKPEIVAPGSEITSCARNNGTLTLNGTSMATPHIAGVCALLKQLHPDWTSDQIKAVLMTTSVSLFDNGNLIDAFTQGAGRVDAYKAAYVKTLFDKGGLSFGYVNTLELPHNSTIELEITNTHSVEQEYTISINNLPVGVSISSSYEFLSIPANSSRTITFTLEVNENATTRLNSGKIDITGTFDTDLHLPWAFVKNSVWWVDNDGDDTNNPGTELEPFQTINYALNSNAQDYDFIFVKNGAYGPFRNTGTHIENFTIASEYYFNQNQNDIEETIINCENNYACIVLEQGPHTIMGFSVIGNNSNYGIIIQGVVNSTLNNLIIKNNKVGIGNSNSIVYGNNLVIEENTNENPVDENTTGFFNYMGYLYLKNSWINNNSITSSNNNSVSGVLNDRGTVILENCNLHNNSNFGTGSTSNVCFNDGTMHIINSNIYSNNSDRIIYHQFGNLIIENSYIHNNTNQAIYSRASLNIKHCYFYENNGGINAQHNTIIENSSFYSNTGERLFFLYGDNELRNVILYNNDVTELFAFSGQPSLSIINSILYNNDGNIEFYTDESDVHISYSNVQGGESIFEPGSSSIYTFENNIDIDPQFIDTDNDNFHLQPTSPCIDAGDPTADCKYEPMPHGCAVNMGIYGNTSEATSKTGIQNYASIPYQNNFETGETDEFWQLTENTVVITENGNGANGTDSWISMNEDKNEASFFVNLIDKEYPVVSFFAKTNGITDPNNGIYFADDCGGSFVKVADLPNTESWANYKLNIRKLADDNNVTINESFAIMFKFTSNTSSYSIDEFAIEELLEPELQVAIDDCNFAFSITSPQPEYTYNIHYKHCVSGIENMIIYENTPQYAPIEEEGCYKFWVEVETSSGSINFTPLEQNIYYASSNVIQINPTNNYLANATSITFSFAVTNLTNTSYLNLVFQSDLPDDLTYASSDDFVLIDPNNQIISATINNLEQNETVTLNFTVDINDLSIHETVVCIAANGQCYSLSVCETVQIQELAIAYNYIADNTPYCENTYIAHKLNGSDDGVPYTLVRDYGTANQHEYSVLSGHGEELGWREINAPGTYNVFADFGGSTENQMIGTWQIEAAPISGTPIILPSVQEDVVLANADYYIPEDIIIELGGKLTITNCTLNINTGNKIVVQPGGKLIIDGSILTSQCSNFWQGIEVVGNPRLSQNEVNQGTVVIKNNSIIEKSTDGIVVGSITHQINRGGGILQIDNNVVFRNNISSIRFDKYSESQKYSFINGCTFETGDYLFFNNKVPQAFIYIWGIQGLKITNCSFTNLEPNLYSGYDKGTGIECYDAGLKILYNRFNELGYGVHANGTSASNYTLAVSSNKFQNNQTGLYFNAASNIKVTENTITPSSRGTGIIVSQTGDYIIEENYFHDILNSGRTTGIVFGKGYEKKNLLYKNYFSNINTAVFSIENTGMTFECNEFSGNYETGIYISESGAYQSQGDKYYPIGNRFLSNATRYDVYSSDDKITYFHHPKNIYLPKFVNENINLFHVLSISTNNCPSHLYDESIGGELEKITQLESQVIENQFLLEEITDGGNTESTNEDIENTEPSEALKLRNSLLKKSPNLSDTVMVNASTKEDVLPAIMLTQILKENPQAAKSKKVNEVLDNRENPLPDYMRELIDEGLDSLSLKEIIEFENARLRTQKAHLFTKKLYIFAEDTLQSSKDSLVWMLENNNQLASRYSLLSYYLAKEDVAYVQLILNSIPEDFELNPIEQNEFNKMQQLVNIQLNLIEANKSYFEVDSIQKSLLYTLSEDSITKAGASARSIISLIDDVDFHYKLLNIEYVDDKGSDGYETSTTEKFVLFPTTASNYFIVEYALSEKELFETVTIDLFNENGEKQMSFPVIQPANQFVVECKDLEEGVYWCRKFVSGSLSKQERVIIMKETGNNTIILDEKGELTNTELNNLEKGIKIYPNPAKDYFVLCYNLPANITNRYLNIVDVNGKIVFTYKIEKYFGELLIKTDSLNKGTYFVTIGKITKKIVIE